MEPVRPAPPVHHPAGELVDDDDLLVLDDIIDVPLEHHVGLERLVQVMNDLGVVDVVEVDPLDEPRGLEHALGPFGAVLGQHDRFLLLVEFVIARDELLHDRVDADVELALVVGRPRDDQRGARFVDQDRIDFIAAANFAGPIPLTANSSYRIT